MVPQRWWGCQKIGTSITWHVAGKYEISVSERKRWIFPIRMHQLNNYQTKNDLNNRINGLAYASLTYQNKLPSKKFHLLFFVNKKRDFFRHFFENFEKVARQCKKTNRADINAIYLTDFSKFWFLRCSSLLHTARQIWFFIYFSKKIAWFFIMFIHLSDFIDCYNKLTVLFNSLEKGYQRPSLKTKIYLWLSCLLRYAEKYDWRDRFFDWKKKHF